MDSDGGPWFGIRPSTPGNGTPAVCRSFVDIQRARIAMLGGTIRVFGSKAEAEDFAFGLTLPNNNAPPAPNVSSQPTQAPPPTHPPSQSITTTTNISPISNSIPDVPPFSTPYSQLPLHSLAPQTSQLPQLHSFPSSVPYLPPVSYLEHPHQLPPIGSEDFLPQLRTPAASGLPFVPSTHLQPVSSEWRCSLCNTVDTGPVSSHACSSLSAEQSSFDPVSFIDSVITSAPLCEEPSFINAYISYASQFDIPWCPADDMAIAVYFGPQNPYNMTKYLQQISTIQKSEISGVVEALSIVSQHALVAKGGLVKVFVTSMLVKHQFDVCLPKWRSQQWMLIDQQEIAEAAHWKSVETDLFQLESNSVRVEVEVAKSPLPRPFSIARSLAVDAIFEYSPSGIS